MSNSLFIYKCYWQVDVRYMKTDRAFERDK